MIFGVRTHLICDLHAKVTDPAFMEKAALITIGDELLKGLVADRNASYLARRLSELGLEVVKVTTVADDHSSIREAIREQEGSVDLLLITGGLGPTDDDPTKEVLMRHFDVGIERNEGIERDLREYLAQRGRDVSDRDLAQADMPQGAEIFRNPRGSAPAIRFDRKGTRTIAMPGVPHEMQALFEEYLLPRLENEMDRSPLPSRSVVTSGCGESSLVRRIDDIVRRYEGKGLDFAYLASPGVVRIRIMSKEGGESAERILEEAIDALQGRIPEHFVGVGEESFERHIGRILEEGGWSVATAESCTGGYIAHLLTSVPGSSAYYQGGIVAYSNEVKKAALGVEEEALDGYGAVSEAVVQQMARGVRERFGTRAGIATSGVMGPSGGSEEKPVGTAWLAVSDEEGTASERWYLGQQRDTNIEKGARAALNLLRKKLQKFR